MALRALAAVALAAAAAVPATAEAVLVCTVRYGATYVCKDTARPECVAYGAVAGTEFELGTYCR